MRLILSWLKVKLREEKPRIVAIMSVLVAVAIVGFPGRPVGYAGLIAVAVAMLWFVVTAVRSPKPNRRPVAASNYRRHDRQPVARTRVR